MATLAEKRKRITDFLDGLYDILEPTGKNKTHFHQNTDGLSDKAFIDRFTKIVNDPKLHLYIEYDAFVNEPDYDTVEKAADYVGDEYCHIYDYIVFPHLSDDLNHPQATVNKIFNGYVNLRRVQQLVNNKNHIPTHTDKRDPRTGQVTMESRAAGISDVEQFALICQGNMNILKEMFGPRGGDQIMRNEMESQIATSGVAYLSEMHDSKFNKTALNTVNTMYLAAALETNMITNNGVLPRTIFDENRKLSTIDRDNSEKAEREKVIQ